MFKLYLKLRKYIIDKIREKEVPFNKWKKVVIVRRITYFLYVISPLIVYFVLIFIFKSKINVSGIMNNIIKIVFLVGFIFLIYLIIKFKSMVQNTVVEDFGQRFKNIGLKNKEGETLIFKKKYYDLEESNKEIYIFGENDVDCLNEKDNPSIIRGLQNIFKGDVEIVPDSMYDFVKFIVKTKRRDNCTILTVNDTWVVENMLDSSTNSLLVYGKPGTGKTFILVFFVQLIINSVREKGLEVIFYWFDQKLSTARKLGIENCQNFYAYQNVNEGFKKILKEYDEEIKINHDNKIRVIIIDEATTMITNAGSNKKEIQEAIGKLIFQCREDKYIVIQASQIGHKSQYADGVKDAGNQNMILTGNPKISEQRLNAPEDIRFYGYI